MESERKSKGIIIGVLCAVIVFMSIGFAALSSQLTIRGNATISDTWNVQITNIEKKKLLLEQLQLLTQHLPLLLLTSMFH